MRNLASSATILGGQRLVRQSGGAKTLNLVMPGALMGGGYLPFQAVGMAEVLAEEFGTTKVVMNMAAVKNLEPSHRCVTEALTPINGTSKFTDLLSFGQQIRTCSCANAIVYR